jgi:HNH endonuclease
MNDKSIIRSLERLEYRKVNENLAREHSRDDEDFDVKQIKKTIKEKTTREALIDARRGQGKFRVEVGVRWNNICAVTGCGIVEVLRASHIKPWRDSTNRERLDPENGLLLAAHVDALFDKDLITFMEPFA